jgi:hypothetical protein
MRGGFSKEAEERRRYSRYANPFEPPAQKKHIDVGTESEELHGKRTGHRPCNHEPTRRYCIRGHAKRDGRNQLRSKRNRPQSPKKAGVYLEAVSAQAGQIDSNQHTTGTARNSENRVRENREC